MSDGRATPYRVRTWPCLFCRGAGCEECDGKGQRWSVTADLGNHNGFSARGTGSPDDRTIEALKAVAAAAAKEISDA